MANWIDSSSRQAVQRQKLAGLFGPAHSVPVAVQRQEMEENDEPLQRRSSSPNSALQTQEGDPPIAAAENRTGMPDQLKANLEAMSGFDLSDIRVHRNSGKPAQLSALAYAQGNEIHLGPGQEKHLPHEAWHVVQQKQGRVQVKMQMPGVGFNDDEGLEREADDVARTSLSGSIRSGGEVKAYAGLRHTMQFSTNHSPGKLAQRHVVQALFDVEPPVSAPVQRTIGDGGLANYGRRVFHVSHRCYKIVGVDEFINQLHYLLKDADGNVLWVAAKNPAYDLENNFAQRTQITFNVSRRQGSARTYTTFANADEALKVLKKECFLSEEDASCLVGRKDWSYPMLKKLMETLQKTGTVQPGLSEGERLWKMKQPARIYSILTTGLGSQLAQIVGCHLMEYQETNNATQGPITSKDRSRKKQQQLSAAILALPAEQASLHALGVGDDNYSRLHPAMFDVKFEDGVNKVFTKPAGAKTFKVFQSAVAARDQQFGYLDTLLPAARRDRKEALKRTLAAQEFEYDTMLLVAEMKPFSKTRPEDSDDESSTHTDHGLDSNYGLNPDYGSDTETDSEPEKEFPMLGYGSDTETDPEPEMEFPMPDCPFMSEHMGVVDDDSDCSLEADTDWEFPYTSDDIGEWTLQEFYQYVFKSNVYAGVLLKDTSAKIAELDILRNNPMRKDDTATLGQISLAKLRRQGVKQRVNESCSELARIMGELCIDIHKVSQLIEAWKSKRCILENMQSEAADYAKHELQLYGERSLLELKIEGYPMPLAGWGEKSLSKFRE